MKKIIALFLATLFLLSLFACASDSGKDTSAPSTGGTATSNAPPAQGSDKTSDAPPAQGSENTPAPGTHVRAGYIDDDVDYFAREPYEFAFVHSSDISILFSLGAELKRLGSRFNYNLTSYSAQGDMDNFVSIIEVLVDQGIDGVIHSPYVETYRRIYEVLEEANVPQLTPLSSFMDEQGRNMIPVVLSDGYKSGELLADWVLDNYKEFFGDIDLSKAGLITVSLSIDRDIQARADGGKNRFLERQPDFANRVFEIDMSDTGFSIQDGFNKAATIYAANANIDHWFIISGSEEWGVGTLRAAESIGISENVVLTTVGSVIALSGEWDDPGNSPSWRAVTPEYTPQYAAIGAAALVALRDGRATFKTLWLDEPQLESDFASRYYIPNEVIPRATYKDYIARMDVLYGRVGLD